MRNVMTALLAATLALGACKGRRARPETRGLAPESQSEVAPQVPFEVRTDAQDLVFFWFDEGGNAHGVTRAGEIPEARRGVVRVDPSRPELRSPGWVYVTDLRTPRPNGTFPARSVRPDALSQQLLAMAGHTGALGTPPPEPPTNPTPAAGANAQPTGAPAVIIYGASWCSACHQAAAWMRSRHIAFVEKDIEQDPAAAAEMTDKARRAGVPTGSIPIIDVRGRIFVGFSAPDIERALGG